MTSFILGPVSLSWLNSNAGVEESYALYLVPLEPHSRGILLVQQNGAPGLLLTAFSSRLSFLSCDSPCLVTCALGSAPSDLCVSQLAAVRPAGPGYPAGPHHQHLAYRTVTESKLVLLTARWASKSRDKLLGQE